MSGPERPADERRRETDERRALRASRVVVGLFGAAALALAAFATVLWRGGQTQLEGVLLALALGLVALGFVLAAKFVVPTERGEEERDPGDLPPPFDELKSGGARYGRRGFLALLVALPAAGFALAAILRALGVGPETGRTLAATAWRPGVRLVRDDGTPVRAVDVRAGTMAVVFPEGATDAPDSQVNVLRVAAERLRPGAGRADWAPEGIVGYSRVCTHAGCPVGLYQTGVERLFCPCHQAVFDVLDGARPIFGPATRPLPQLPLEIDDEGFLRARGDFAEPVGPSYWERDRPS